MKIDYKNIVVSQNIDINKLRPDKSYDYLIKNRNASFKDLLDSKDKLKKFLIQKLLKIISNFFNFI